MKTIAITLAVSTLVAVATHAQQLSYTPEVVLGHRSYFYMHQVSYKISDKIKINNLSLFDTEYTTDKENIFFIRNTASYTVSKRFTLNAAFGMKNPGAFFSAFVQYRVSKPTQSFSYAIGTTYQKGFTLEQSLSFEYTPYLTTQKQAYFSVLAIGNVNTKIYQRGLQFIRLGLKQDKLMYGLASNFDQFNNSKKTLENIGAFVKHNF
ncbi:hypothetical protein D3C79_315160 [compost metagenome]